MNYSKLITKQVLLGKIINVTLSYKTNNVREIKMITVKMWCCNMRTVKILYAEIEYTGMR